MPLGIENIEYYLPKRTISSTELSDKLGFSKSFVEEKIGVRNLYIADENEKTSDLCVKAVEKLLTKQHGVKEKLGVLVVCTQTPDFQIPHTAAIVHGKLGLDKSIACFDLSLGCSGFVYGLSVVKSFMNENDLEYGILLTAETYSTIIDDKDKNTKPIFSDACAATLIGRSGSLIPHKFTYGTDGHKYNYLILKSEKNEICTEKDYLYMNGRGIFQFGVNEIPKDIEKCLSINSTTMDEIDYFVFHQASKFMLDALAKELGLDKSDKRIIRNIGDFGNTVSSSIPIGLKEAFDFKTKMPIKILVSGFGVGLSWASTILTFNKKR
jgi:3-oxoacyl-[acyl-carrier-protein] synthase III